MTPAPYAGSWTYEITPTNSGSRVVLTEVATFKNPLFRVMTRIFGQTKYMDEHLEDLAKKIRRNRAPDVAPPLWQAAVARIDKFAGSLQRHPSGRSRHVTERRAQRGVARANCSTAGFSD